MGRRIKKKFNNKIVRYLWDNNVILHEWEYNATDEPQLVTSEIGEVSFNKPEPINNLITWVYENGSFVPIGKLTDNESFSIVSDYLGTPVQAFNEQGELVWARELDIYGRIRKLQGDKEFPFRQLGQYEDIETGLYYNRFRYYDPNTGVYISQDPIGLAGGLAFYAYVRDTNKFVDIFGLDCATIHHYKGDQNNRFGHYSIEVDNGKEIVHTHQVITTRDLSKTTIITVSDDMTPSKSVTIDIPDAISAIDYQKSLIGKNLGAYDIKTNSCVDHISEVLREGGVNIPKSPLEQMKYLKELGF